MKESPKVFFQIHSISYIHPRVPILENFLPSQVFTVLVAKAKNKCTSIPKPPTHPPNSFPSLLSLSGFPIGAAGWPLGVSSFPSKSVMRLTEATRSSFPVSAPPSFCQLSKKRAKHRVEHWECRWKAEDGFPFIATHFTVQGYFVSLPLFISRSPAAAATTTTTAIMSFTTSWS